MLLAWEVGQVIVAEDFRSVLLIAVGIAACCVPVKIMRDWRSGFYIFFIWMMIEDLVRKYLGNNLALFFGKDILLAFVYFALYEEVRRHRERTFRPPFMFCLSLFVWLGLLQVFNQNSPHILYGLLGFKMYFYYVPLLFVGYALIRTDEDLQRFLMVNAVIAAVIGILGIIQAILGNTFLNPAVLAPELQELGNLHKSSPLSGKLLSLPDSVFVSAGRFSQFLVVAFVLVMGTAGYLLLHTHKRRNLIFAVIGVLGVATLLSGSRGAVVGIVASALVLSAGFLWGAPWRQRQAHRLAKAVRRSVIGAAIGLALLLLLFPEDAGSRMALYTETLDPSSSAYDLGNRSWDYPVKNLLSVLNQPHWAMGNGIGTASLGTQYVAKLIGQNKPDIGAEAGYGTLILEMGILGPVLWILWTAVLLYYSWKVLLRLKETRLFPIGFAIFWYAFLLLYPFTFASLVAYQNYISTAYLWLLLGILFRLPDLLSRPSVLEDAAPRSRRGAVGFRS